MLCAVRSVRVPVDKYESLTKVGCVANRNRTSPSQVTVLDTKPHDTGERNMCLCRRPGADTKPEATGLVSLSPLPSASARTGKLPFSQITRPEPEPDTDAETD